MEVFPFVGTGALRSCCEAVALQSTESRRQATVPAAQSRGARNLSDLGHGPGQVRLLGPRCPSPSAQPPLSSGTGLGIRRRV